MLIDQLREDSVYISDEFNRALHDKHLISYNADSVKQFLIDKLDYYNKVLPDIIPYLNILQPLSHITWYEFGLDLLSDNQTKLTKGGILITTHETDELLNRTTNDDLHKKIIERQDETSLALLCRYAFGNKQICGLVPIMCVFFLDHNYRLLLRTNGEGNTVPVMHLMLRGDNTDTSSKIMQTTSLMMPVAFMTISLLNSRYIVTREHKVDEAIQRKRVKRGKLRLVKYHTVEVETPRTKYVADKPTQRSAGNSTSSMPLHLVPGHFADYTKGKGLFGKYNGMFFIPAHFRGNRENGVIDKDYKIKVSNDARNSVNS